MGMAKIRAFTLRRAAIDANGLKYQAIRLQSMRGGPVVRRSAIGYVGHAMGLTEFIPPPTRLNLKSDEIHVWRVALGQPDDVVNSLEEILSEDERRRAGRFLKTQDQRRFTVARAALRAILGNYLALPPREVRFRYADHGKPELDLPRNEDSIRFNLSHSHELALCAVCRDREVGIDVEYVRAGFPVDEIAPQFFSQAENAALAALTPDERARAFFACWTRKEAYIKADGKGLSIPLDRFDVSVDPAAAKFPLHVNGDPIASSEWLIQSLRPHEDYFAAVAARRPDWTIECWQWAWRARGVAV
jgi:4'-phosphopantetheinyl transferase